VPDRRKLSAGIFEEAVMNGPPKVRLHVLVSAAALAVSGMETSAQAPIPQERCRTENQPRSNMDLPRSRADSMRRDASSATLRDAARDQQRRQERDRIYGSDLMTAEERDAYLVQLQQLPTVDERVRFRLQHQRDLLARAAAHGQSLPNAPGRSRIQRQERERQKEFESAAAVRTADWSGD
jgi:hypothetical protein